MAIDWSKYGVKKEGQNKSSIDWSKYEKSEPKQALYPFNTPEIGKQAPPKTIAEFQSRTQPSQPVAQPRSTPMNHVTNIEQVTGEKSSNTVEELDEIQRRSEHQRMGRDIPILGGVLGGADIVRDKLEPVSKALMSVYTPGGGLAPIQAGYKATGQLLNRVAPRLGNTLGGRVTQEAIKEGVVSAPLAAGQTLASGQTDLREVAKQGAIGGGLGVAMGGAVPLAGAAAGKYLSPKVKELFGKFKGSPNPAQDEVITNAMNQPIQARTGVRESDAYLNNVLEEIKPLVQDRITPPLENPTELARYVQRHLDDVPLNEVKKLSYDDLNELATEIQKNASVYDTAVQVARERGHNLDDLFAGKLPSRRADILQGERNKVYGAYPEKELKLARTDNLNLQRTPELPTTESRPTLKPHSSLKDDALEIVGELFPSQPTAFSTLAKNKPYEAMNTQTKSQLVTKLDKEPFSAKKKASELYINLVDDMKRVGDFEEFAKNKIGELNPTDSPYSLAMASRGSDIISNQILTHGIVDATGNVVGKSLKEVISPIPRGSFVDFEDYLVNRHAITRFKRGEKVYDDALKWTPERGAQEIARLEQRYPMFKEVAENYYDFNNKMVENWLVNEGLMSRAQAAKMITENPTYVPMKRQFSELEKGNISHGSKKGLANQKAPIKEYSKEGSKRKIYSPIESTIENVDAFVKTAKRNKVMQSIVTNIRKNPEDFKDWAEIVTDVPNNMKDIDITSSTGLDDLMNRLNEDFDKVLKRQSLDKDNIVRVMMDGDPVHLKINDKQFLDAVLSLGPEGQNVLLDSIGQVTRVFKVLTTGANPIFGLARNLPRDIVQGFIARKNSSTAQFGKDLLESFVSSMGDGKLYNSYKNIGGGHASSVAADRNLLAQSKRSILPQNRIKSSIPTVYGTIENFMNALESVPRLGEFKRAGMGTADQKLKGMLDAQDITVNFKKKGRIGKQIDKVFPYFNAAMQGLDKLGRMYKDNPVKAMTRTFSSITLPTIALYAMNYDNPEYQKVTKHVRDNYHLIPKGDGTFFRIAKHRELGIPFSAAVERALDTWLKDDPEAFRNFSDSVRIAFAPPGLSGALESGSLTDRVLGGMQDTIAGPFVDLAKNQNFMGAPVVPGNLSRLSPEHQYDERTSEVSKALSRITKTISNKTGLEITTSPKQLDHLIRSYGGVIGQFGLPATTKGTSVKETLDRQITVDPVYSNETQTQFYEIKDKLDTAQADFKATGEESKEFNDDMRKVYNTVNDLMSDFRKASREIENSDIPSAQKQKYMREIRIKINDLADRTNQVYRQTK